MARTITAGILIIGVTLVGCAESSTGPERVAPSSLSSREGTTAPDAVTEAATESVTGIVVDVVGDLTATTSFRLLANDGSRLDFAVDPNATFHSGPMSHIRDHLLSGTPVRVEYVIGDSLVASHVEDADHEH